MQSCVRRPPRHRALVVSTGKNSARVSIDGEDGLRVAQLRRMTGNRFMPVPGDVVEVQLLEDGQAVVERIEARAFTLKRRSAGGRSKTMAANVDLLVIVSASGKSIATAHDARPAAGVRRDRRHVAARSFLRSRTSPSLRWCGVPVQHVRKIGLSTVSSSIRRPARTSTRLRNNNRGRRAMLVGNSGVGKSTIFRALGGESAIGDVSRTDSAEQTTTAGRLYRIGSGFLIDSPGSASSAWRRDARRWRRLSARCASRESCRLPIALTFRSPTAVQAAIADGRIRRKPL